MFYTVIITEFNSVSVWIIIHTNYLSSFASWLSVSRAMMIDFIMISAIWIFSHHQALVHNICCLYRRWRRRGYSSADAVAGQVKKSSVGAVWSRNETSSGVVWRGGAWYCSYCRRGKDVRRTGWRANIGSRWPGRSAPPRRSASGKTWHFIWERWVDCDNVDSSSTSRTTAGATV